MMLKIRPFVSAELSVLLRHAKYLLYLKIFSIEYEKVYF